MPPKKTKILPSAQNPLTLKKLFKELNEEKQRKYALQSMEKSAVDTSAQIIPETQASGSAAQNFSHVEVQNNDSELIENSQVEHMEINDGFQIVRNNRKRIRTSSTDDARSGVRIQNRFQPLEQKSREKEVQQSVMKKTKPPPIFVEDISMKEISNILKEITEKDDFFVNKLKSAIRITSKNIEVFEKIVAILRDKEVKFITFTPSDKKNKTIVLKKLFGGYDEKEIEEEIKNMKLESIEIVKIVRINKIVNQDRSSGYRVILTCNSDVKVLKKVTKLFNQKIVWDDLRKKPIYQCYNCQLTGHTSQNCGLPWRCVKCIDPHPKGNCPNKGKEKNEFQVKCVNCGKVGHPASWRGCEFFQYVNMQEADRRKKVKNIRSQEARKSWKKVTEGVLFSDMSRNVDKNFPPLRPTTQAMGYTQQTQQARNAQPQNNRYTQENNQQNKKSEMDDIKSFMLDFRNEMMTCLNERLEHMNNRINMNSQRINEILRRLTPQCN